MLTLISLLYNYLLTKKHISIYLGYATVNRNLTINSCLSVLVCLYVETEHVTGPEMNTLQGMAMESFDCSHFIKKKL